MAGRARELRRRALSGACALALFLALVAVPVTGCLRPRAKREAVRFWGLGREGEVVRELVPEFERRHPGITVEVQQIPWTAAHEKLLTAHVGRETPDVAQMGNTWLPEFSAVGALERLDARAAASPATSGADDFPGIRATNVVEGALYGVPWYVDTRVLFYRSDVLAAAGFAEPPRSWSAWRASMEAVKRLDPSKYAMLVPIEEWHPAVILGLQQGSTLLRDGDRFGAFREPPFRRAAEFLVALFRDSLAPPLGSVQPGNIYQQFAARDYSMYLTGPWNIGEFRRRLPASLEGAWSTAPLPSPDGTEYPGVSMAGGASLVLFASSPRKDAAWKLVRYLSEPEQQLRFLALTGDLPARRSAWDAPALAGDPRLAAFREELPRVVPLPRVPEWEQIATRVFDHLEPAMRGRKGVAECLEDLDAEVDRILAKRRWLLEKRPRG